MTDDNDDDLFYGTPFPPLEDDELAGKKPELDQTVRDWKGRRRFHGAFTGGFSAGYFNSVGTEKGWVPSQFVSKRGNKYDKDSLKSRPEDYMDEEDFSIFGIAPKKVHTKDQFKGPEKDAFAGLRSTNATIIDVLKDTLKCSDQSIGVKLLKAMKIGKRYKEAVLQCNPTPKKVYGCELPPEIAISRGYSANYDSDDEPFDPNAFVLPYKPNSGVHGIGYKPLTSSLLEDASKDAPLTAVVKGKKLKISGEAFGYGALEDEDDDLIVDDAQVYSHDDLSKYDFELGSKKGNLALTASINRPKISNSCRIKGFVRSESIKPLKSDTALSEIPRHWRPRPPHVTHKKRRSRWDIADHRSSSEPSSLSQTNSLGRSALNANTRAIILGEGVHVVTAIKKKTEEPRIEVKETKFETPKPEIELKSTPLVGFFSKFVKGEGEVEKPLPPGLSKVLIPQRQEKLPKEEVKVESSVGKILRETYQWHPHSLLCKRFEVPHPYPQFPDVVGVIDLRKKDQNFEERDVLGPLPKLKSDRGVPIFVPVVNKPRNNQSQVSEPKRELVNVELGKLEDRASMDLFKAIFSSDDESDGENKSRGNEPQGPSENNIASSSLPENSNTNPQYSKTITPSTSSVLAQTPPQQEVSIKQPSQEELVDQINIASTKHHKAKDKRKDSRPSLPSDKPVSKKLKRKKSSKEKKKKKYKKKKRTKKESGSSSSESDSSVEAKIIKFLREHRN